MVFSPRMGGHCFPQCHGVLKHEEEPKEGSYFVALNFRTKGLYIAVFIPVYWCFIEKYVFKMGNKLFNSCPRC